MLKLKHQFKLSQNLKMTMRLRQSIGLLALSQKELKEAIRKEIEENPLLEVKSSDESEIANSLPELAGDWRGSVRSVAGGIAPQLVVENTLKTPETLRSHLTFQVQTSALSESEKNLLTLLVFDLDERGYLQTSLDRIAERESVSKTHLKKALCFLQSMDPSGVGARDLKECLLIQIRQMGEDTQDMVALVTDHLEGHKKIKMYLRFPLVWVCLKRL